MSEMTSLITEIPTRFPSISLKYGVSRRTNKFDEPPSNLPRISLDMVDSWTGEVTIQSDSSEKASTGLVEFRQGDVLFSKLRPYLAKGFSAEQNGAASPEFLVFEPKEFSPKYLLYLILSEEFIDRVDASTYGTKMPRASWDFIGNIQVPNPPIEQQERIGDYLDSRTAKIDSAIENLRNLRGLLEEKRQALISKSVTQGVSSNPDLINSGSDWIGDVPEGWSTIKLKFVTKRIVDGAHETPDYVNEGIPFLTVSDLTSGQGVDLAGAKRISEDTHQKISKRTPVEKGDILLTKDGTIGEVRMVNFEEPVSIFVSVALIKPDNSLIDPHYLKYALKADNLQEQYMSAEEGSALTHIHLVDLREVELPLPPRIEQEKIAEKLRERLKTIDDVLGQAREEISLLQEKRQALITKAVTGQIDLSDWQPDDKQEASP